MIKAFFPQKLNRLPDNLAFAHHQGMGSVDHNMIRLACQHGALDGNLPIVRSWNEQAVYPIDGAVTGHDSHAKLRYPECVWKRVVLRAKLPAGRPVDKREEPPAPDPTHHFAAAVGRADHHHPSHIIRRMPGKIAP